MPQGVCLLSMMGTKFCRKAALMTSRSSASMRTDRQKPRRTSSVAFHIHFIQQTGIWYMTKEVARIDSSNIVLLWIRNGNRGITASHHNAQLWRTVCFSLRKTVQALGSMIFALFLCIPSL